MLFHIKQTHAPHDCPYGKGGSKSLFDGESNTTFPLAMNVVTFVKPADSNNRVSSLIFTVWPPTLMARRKAT